MAIGFEIDDRHTAWLCFLKKLTAAAGMFILDVATSAIIDIVLPAANVDLLVGYAAGCLFVMTVG
ncbi:hypothetical protein DPSP01_009902 [Paraphaeosphaeria sporulosa]